MKNLFSSLAFLVVFVACNMSSADAIEPGQQFVSVAFHDVVDNPADLDDTAVTTDRLIAFFDFLKGDGWTVISLDDVQAAHQKKKMLPRKSILLTFDDGYESVYSRVYPLAMAYNYPIVSALVGEWMSGPMTGTVLYGGKQVPRSNFLSWDAVREMQRSGLVEFASHTHSLHKDVLANVQGSRMPIATTQRFDPARGTYETETEYENFLVQNFKLDHAVFMKELKKMPRAVVWPFGRYSDKTIEVAKRAGYTFALSLDPEPSDASDLLRIARYLPTENPKLGEIIGDLRFADGLSTVQRLACLDPAEIWSENPQEFDVKLGQVIERIRAMGISQLVIPAAYRDGQQKIQSWFLSSNTQVRADALSRIVWQMQTRAGVSTTLSVPLPEMRAVGMTDAQIQKWFWDLARLVPVQSLIIPELNQFDTVPPAHLVSPLQQPWETRKIRQAMSAASLPAYEQQALKGVKVVDSFRPGVQLYTIKSDARGAKLSPAVDLTLFSTTLEHSEIQKNLNAIEQSGVLNNESTRRRMGLWFTAQTPPDAERLAQTSLQYQVKKGTAIGWCPDLWLQNNPDAAQVAPAVSAARFPLRP